MKKRPKDFLREGRRDRLIKEMVHDPYQSKSKLPEPTVCPGCHAVFHRGRWTWAEIPKEAHEEMCPACQRIHDKVPAGFLTLSGAFFQKHREEITNLVHNTEATEKAEHPLERIMKIEKQEEGILITFTGAHLTRRVGEAIHHAYGGELDFQYSDEDSLFRMNWKR